MSATSPTARASLWEWTQTLLLAVNLAWTTLCLGGYRPETMVVTATLTSLLLVVHLLSRGFVTAPRAHLAGWLLLPFLIYAGINVRWITPVRWLGWRDWMWWAQLIAVFWVVLNGVRSPAPRRALFAVLLTLGVVTVALACYQRFVRPEWLMLGRVQVDQYVTRASGSFGIPNSFGAFLLLLIPAAGAFAFQAYVERRRRLVWAAIAAFLVLGLVLSISRGAWLGLALALVVWPLAASRWTWKRRIGAAAVVGLALATFGAGLFFASVSVRDRLVSLVKDSGETTRPVLWRSAWQMFRERPSVGTGAGSFNVRFEKYRPEGFLTEPHWAHNDYINTLSDYGWVGFGLFFGVGGVITWRCLWRRRAAEDVAVNWLDSPQTTAALAVGLLAFTLQLFVDFHFKIPALAMAFASVAALVVQRRWPAGETRHPTAAVRAGWTILAVMMAVGGLGFVVPAWKAEALRYNARERINGLAGRAVASADYRDELAASREELQRAVAIDPANAQAWADVAYAASLRAHLFPPEIPGLGIEADNAASRALAISPICAEFWIRRGVARDMEGRWFEGSLDFVRATTLAPTASSVWFYYADHLSHRTSERGLTEAALALCLRLDPQNQDGLGLRQRLAISHKASP